MPARAVQFQKGFKMTAPDCKDCFRVRRSASMYRADGETLHCGLLRVSRPTCEVMRADGAECGPDAKLFSARQGGPVMTPSDIEQALDAAFLAWGQTNASTCSTWALASCGVRAATSLSNSPAVVAGAFSQVMG